MKKKILVVYYSQSGQLEDIVEQVSQPWSEAGHSVEIHPIRMKHDFPFPWNGAQFFDAMPESVLGIPSGIQPFPFREEKYDLIIFGWQPWFLSPSIPATSALLDPEFRKRLSNTPVVTIIGARNMWINAQEQVKNLIRNSDGKLVGNIVFTDRHMNMVSAVTIQYWMFTGRKDKLLGIFPRPGVATKEIEHSGKFGETIRKSMELNDWQGLQQELVSQNAVEPKTTLMFIEGRAPKIFRLWANFTYGKKNRAFRLQVFKYYLLFALFIIAPVILLIYLLLVYPLTGKQVRERKAYFSGVN